MDKERRRLLALSLCGHENVPLCQVVHHIARYHLWLGSRRQALVDHGSSSGVGHISWHVLRWLPLRQGLLAGNCCTWPLQLSLLVESDLQLQDGRNSQILWLIIGGLESIVQIASMLPL